MAKFKRKRTSKSQRKVFRAQGRKDTTAYKAGKNTLVAFAKKMKVLTKTIETRSGCD